jgi:hypothetical protein
LRKKIFRFQVNQDDIQVENDSNDGNDGNGGQDVPNPLQNVQNNAQAAQIVVPVGTPRSGSNYTGIQHRKIKNSRVFR